MIDEHRAEIIEALKPVKELIEEIENEGVIPNCLTSNKENIGVCLEFYELKESANEQTPQEHTGQWVEVNGCVFNLDKIISFSTSEKRSWGGTEPKKQIEWELKALFGSGSFWQAEESILGGDLYLGTYDSKLAAHLTIRDILNGKYNIENSDLGIAEEPPPEDGPPYTDAVDDQDGSSELPPVIPENDIPF